MGIQIIEDAAKWKERKEREKHRKIVKGVYGLIALISLILALCFHSVFVVPFIGFGFASKA